MPRGSLSVGSGVAHSSGEELPGLTWAASAGATTAELMHRGGHASPTAALRYQHATEDRDRALADAMARLAPMGGSQAIEPRDGRAKTGEVASVSKGISRIKMSSTR
jgi:hypothetical protein